MRRIKTESGMERYQLPKDVPYWSQFTKSYMGFPRVHKKNNPLRPIASSRGSGTYGVAKELASVLKPMSGKTIHHVKLLQEFVEDMKNMRLEGECISSYDVSSLFAYIPITSAIEIIKNKLEQDTELPNRTTMSANNIIVLWAFCFCNTYFLFQGHILNRSRRQPLGLLWSPIVANLYMESFEHRAIKRAVNPPSIWRRYVDDTFVIQQQSYKDEFFQHIISVDHSIIFTAEETRPDGSLPFQDTLITPERDGTLTTSVYRKPSHIDLYLQWDNHHTLACKYSVINTLTHRAKAVGFHSPTAQRRTTTSWRGPDEMQMSKEGHQQSAT